MHDKRFGWYAAIKLGFSVAQVGFSLYTLYDSCKSLTEEHTSKNGFICVVSAMATAATVASMGNSALGKLADKAREYGDIAAEGIELADLGSALPGKTVSSIYSHLCLVASANGDLL